jgi:hypothetical protein
MAENDAHRPTVHVDAGAEGRVMVADSLSFYEHEPWINDVAVGASFAGAPTAAMAMRQGVKAWIAAVVLVTTCITGCVAFDARTAKARAANELACPSAELDVHRVSTHTFDVSGCGSTATSRCVGNRGYGDWSCVREQ